MDNKLSTGFDATTPNLKSVTITPEVITKKAEPIFEFESNKQSA